MTIGYSIIYRCLYQQVCNSACQDQGLIFGKEAKKKKKKIKGIAWRTATVTSLWSSNISLTDFVSQHYLCVTWVF